MRRSPVVLALSVSVLVSGCGGEPAAPSPAPPAPPPAVTTTAAAATSTTSTTSTSASAPATPGNCGFTLNLGTGAATTTGDQPQITHTKDGLFVGCAGGQLLQLRGDRDTPALAVDFAGKQTRLTQGNAAVVGPYRFTLLEQSGNGGRQLGFELTKS
ncbi:hypothetical protein ACIOD2_31225 [Amycolatopsis sp. NPDC088138]|uniref:hypothetical protein n=1 Tax=Amycolatopsis sp. NPDC088138 TaxID=3363938 RepID=UPI003810468C